MDIIGSSHLRSEHTSLAEKFRNISRGTDTSLALSLTAPYFVIVANCELVDVYLHTANRGVSSARVLVAIWLNACHIDDGLGGMGTHLCAPAARAVESLDVISVMGLRCSAEAQVASTGV